MKYNVKNIMTKAWNIFFSDKTGITFGEALHRAWQCAKEADDNAKAIEQAKAESGVAEETKTWYGWKMAGREVIHESKCLFQVVVHDSARGDGKTRILSFFGISQTAEVAVA